MQKKNNHTSTLFHYTNKQSVMLSILREGIKFGFCKEKLSDRYCVGIPMISFCDIPIGNSAEHSSKYGRYAIGISKRYVLENFTEGIGPVNYFISEKAINGAFQLLEEEKALKDTLNKLTEGKGKSITLKFKGKTYVGRGVSAHEAPMVLKAFFKSDEFHRSAAYAIGLMKRYESYHNGKKQVNYDECEWRMVIPEFAEVSKDKICHWFWTEEAYDSWRATAKDKFLDSLSLPFSVSDINYIIVPTNKQIPNFIKSLSRLKEVCGEALTNEERSLLYSRVISFEQIRSDF